MIIKVRPDRFGVILIRCVNNCSINHTSNHMLKIITITITIILILIILLLIIMIIISDK